MAPPKFDDLGKAANDLFSKGFEHGNLKLEVKSNSGNGLDFTTKGAHNLAKGSLGGSVEINRKSLFNGVDFKKTINTNGSTSFELSKMINNVGKATLTGSVNNDQVSGLALGKFKQNYTKNNLNLNFNSTLTAKPVLNLDAVYNRNNINAGFAVAFDTSNNNLKSKALAFSLQQNNINATVKSSLNNDVNILLLNKVSDARSLAAQINYNGNVAISLAGKDASNAHGVWNFKVNNEGVLASSFVTKFDSGCEATFSGNFDMKNLTSGGHTLGAGFKFNL